ncbi:hypothetical protein BDN72DRAFT_905404 [Pluteus cervinus]|uniref:Uncharacterized protein n=1 Tax=Pluteus cervinus TaxID=181527 RepID=A0ACD3A2X2_9AGAR|nr:hypothetical protein BDN72DRAFT_905404 [Pluteus cervinus]
MASGNGAPKDEKIKTKHQRFYARNKERLRPAGKIRMKLVRAARRTEIRRIALTSGWDLGIDQLASPPGAENTELSAGNDEFESGAESDDEISSSNTPANEDAGAFSRSTLHVDCAIEDEVNRLTPFNEVNHFDNASRAVYDWLAEWGGLESWPKTLDMGFQMAQTSGRVDEWARSVVDHADRGRLLERLLGQMETTLPLEMWKIRELWRQQTHLVGLVVKALTLIEVRVNLFQKGSFNYIQ